MADFLVPYKLASGAVGSPPINPLIGMRYVVPDLTQKYFRDDVAATVLQTIDKFALEKWNDNDGFRNHLGASLIGQECTRATWYSFHWMQKAQHNGRMQRLFQRGHLEEFRYVEYLKGVGIDVWERDPNTGKQFRVERLSGHFGGSLDGIVSLQAYGIPGYMLAEFKTKGAGKDGTGAKFAELKEKGIMLTNPQHYDQMCVYGAAYQLDYSLYMSTNKNDDDMHVEIVPLNVKRAVEIEAKALYIIKQTTPPPRIALNPSHWKCKGCDFSKVCHFDHLPAKNCRSCQYSSPVENGQWYCRGHQGVIPGDVMRTGCPQWTFIPSPPG